ncbi:hypothetical protein B0F90DRAFT_1814044 [Multifurca ochricompacta]|uniref:Uncharacterized protein n=1 Tax=Multifurca ochricompacta TaxID=376703 RepID=A0AAD4MC01_9AGAM|nr:hypothetical protein B0F90DRAFT_1814044 [Multifurca ochricompacta]
MCTYHDCVEDSEPERKRIRLQVSNVKRRRTNRKRYHGRDPVLTLATPTPYQLADAKPTSSSGESEGVMTDVTSDFVVAKQHAIIDVIDRIPRSDNNLSSESDSLLSAKNSPLVATHALVPQFVSTVGAQADSSLISCLGHFAYPRVHASKDVYAPSNADGHQRAPAFQFQLSRAEMRGQKSHFDSDITKLDVGRLLKCVSCEARWTVKKGAAHKLSHITTCARKIGINPSTLKNLIEEELLKTRNAKKCDRTATPCPDSADAATQTYMETVVAEAQPRRKQRRGDTISTLQPINLTKAAILDRAKILLGAREVVPYNAPEPEPTQTFGGSKLARNHMQAKSIDPIASDLSEGALSSRIALLRSMVGSPSHVQRE